MTLELAPSRGGVMYPGTEQLQGFEWWDAQPQVRSYPELIERIHDEMPSGLCTIGEYGEIVYGTHRYPMKFISVGDPSNGKPNVFISGGVHGYEEGGVEGVMAFFENIGDAAEDHNFIGLPCVSPAAYEKDVRLTGAKQNPNREFKVGTSCQEALLFMQLVERLNRRYAFAADCHETTWTDPTIIAQEGDQTLDPEDLCDEGYLIEVCDKIENRIGRQVIATLEDLGLPYAKGPTVFGETNDGGVLRGIPRHVPLSSHFMTAHTPWRLAPTDQAFTTEPFVTEALFNDSDGLNLRIAAQIVQLQAMLDGVKGRPADPRPLFA